MPKGKTEHRSNSTKVAALTLLKSGIRPIQVSRELSIPTRTLMDWRKASMASVNPNGGARDNNNVMARPAPARRSQGPGLGAARWQPSSTPRGDPPSTESCSEYFL